MTQTLKWPFLGFRLKLTAGQQLISPLTDLDIISLDSQLERVAGRYEREFQKAIINQGQYNRLLADNIVGEYYKGPISVSFPAAADQYRHPEFELEFDYYFSIQENGGAWAIVPAIGIQAFAPKAEDVEFFILEAIHLEFSRKRRLSFIQRIVSAIWFDTIEMLRTDLSYQIPVLNEIHDANRETQREKWLPKVGQMLTFNKKQAYGRKEEMEAIEKAVKGKFTSSILLVGPGGCGKTTLVWELAFRRKRNVGKIWETTAARMIKELTADYGWEENLTQLCQELSGRLDFLFVRNLFELFEVGHYEGNEVSMAEYMKSYLNRGEVFLISECTEEELARIELRAPNFVSNFQVIRINEPKEELEEMIINKVKDLVGNRRVQIGPEAVKEAVRLTRRYMPYAGFPGRPVAFLERMLLRKATKLNQPKMFIDSNLVINEFSEESGIPRLMIDGSAAVDLGELRNKFNQQVFGQEQAVDRITDMIATVKTGLARTGKPIASFLFVGPTGVGKTEMCKALAQFMFSDAQRITRFDMSEFSDPYAVIRLMGEGFQSEGLLSSAIRRQPFSLILFDEIEKAHSSFYDLLLQLLSEGRLSDGRGQLVNFCSTIIIMTSNIGAEKLQLQNLGWNKSKASNEINEFFMREVQKFFRPEIYNRIDEVIPFAPLSRETVRFVVDREIDLFRKREGIEFRAMDLHIEDQVLDDLAERGFEPKYGARQLQRSIRERLVIPLARRLNEENYDDQLIVHIHSGSEEGLEINVEADQLGLELWLEKMNKINFADHSSELRRKLLALEESYLYLGMLSQIDIMERQRKRKGDKFWTNNPSAAKYTNYMALQQRFQDLKVEIENEENIMALACLDIAPYTPSIKDRLEDWKLRFMEFKKDLLSQLKPELNYCQLFFYGNKIEPLAAFYIELLESKSFDYIPHCLWRNPAGDWEWEKVLPDSKPYQDKMKKGYKCAGVKLEIDGALAMTYLENEAGRQDWEISDDDHRQYNVEIHPKGKDLEIPKGILRKDFYRGNPRREVSYKYLKDRRLKIDRPLNRGQLLEVLLESLDEGFIARIEEMTL